VHSVIERNLPSVGEQSQLITDGERVNELHIDACREARNKWLAGQLTTTSLTIKVS
jgi:hypothetical protein